jgi:hypothetical protein
MNPIIIIKFLLLFSLFTSCLEHKNDNGFKRQRESCDRLTGSRKSGDLLELEFFLGQKKYSISNMEYLKVINKKLSDPSVWDFDMSISNYRVHVDYRLRFIDGFTDSGVAVLHLFKDRVVTQVSFATDGGWMGGGPSLYFRLDDILSENELIEFFEDFSSKDKKLLTWDEAKNTQEKLMNAR